MRSRPSLTYQINGLKNWTVPQLLTSWARSVTRPVSHLQFLPFLLCELPSGSEIYPWTQVWSVSALGLQSACCWGKEEGKESGWEPVGKWAGPAVQLMWRKFCVDTVHEGIVSKLVSTLWAPLRISVHTGTSHRNIGPGGKTLREGWVL